MTETRFDNIRRVYILNSHTQDREVNRIVQKGIFRKRNVEVTEKVRENYGETGARITDKILGLLENSLNINPNIAGVKREDLPSLIRPGISLLVSNGKDRKVALLDYGSEYVASYFGYTNNYVTLTIFGDAVTLEQFNTLQVSDALGLKP